MNPKLKTFLIISAKNAVNALLTNTGAWLIVPKDFNLHNLAGLDHIALLALTTILAREGTVWIPKILAWSQS